MKQVVQLLQLKLFVGLKENMYPFLVDDDSDLNKVKGVNKKVIEKNP